MIPKIIEVRVLDGYKLWLRFRDGKTVTVDLSDELWGPMFEPLKDRALFAAAVVHPELHTVTWPNGAHLSPEFLYQQAGDHQRHGHTARGATLNATFNTTFNYLTKVEVYRVAALRKIPYIDNIGIPRGKNAVFQDCK